MNTWCEISPAISLLPCSLNYHRMLHYQTPVNGPGSQELFHTLGREGEGETQKPLGSSELLGAAFWAARSNVLRKLPNARGWGMCQLTLWLLTNEEAFSPTQLPSQFLGPGGGGQEKAQTQKSSAEPF